MKKNLLKGIVITGLALATVLTVSFVSVDAKSIYDEYAINEVSFEIDENVQYTLQEMLDYAIQDEYLAQAEYQAIINEFGEVMPFVRILVAEEAHIDLLLGLYETYGLTVPENTAADSVVIPESISAAIATGVEAEKANIAMYEAFLAQTDLPEDVRLAFAQLQSASEQHLNAFSRDRYNYYGEDMKNQFKNMFRNRLGQERGKGQSRGNRYQTMQMNPEFASVNPNLPND